MSRRAYRVRTRPHPRARQVGPRRRQGSRRRAGRKEGYRPSNKKAKKVLAMHRDGLSYRLISRNLGLSKNTVMEIIRRAG
jgi:DNA-binding NarL/FixJ family response regulator